MTNLSTSCQMIDMSRERQCCTTQAKGSAAVLILNENSHFLLPLTKDAGIASEQEVLQQYTRKSSCSTRGSYLSSFKGEVTSFKPR